MDAVKFAKLAFKMSTGAVVAVVAGAGVFVAVVLEEMGLGVDSLGLNVESTRISSSSDSDSTAAYIAAKSISLSSEEESLSKSA